MPLRLLIVRRRYLGDLALLDPALRGLRERHPGARLAVLVDEGYEEVLAAHPALDAIFAIPKRRPGENPAAYGLRYLALGRRLRRERFDTVADFSPGFRTAALIRLAGIGRWIGFGHHPASFPFGQADVRVEREAAFFQTRPILDIYAALLEPVGLVPHADCRFPIAAGAEERAGDILARHFPGSRRPLLLIHPGGRVARRRWPAASFAAVAARLKEEGAADLLLTCGPGEEALAEEVARQVPGGVPVSAAPPLHVFAALARRAALFFGNDTGSIHVAAGVGTPTVVLFGAQSPAIWRPVGPRHVVLQGPRPCPCPAPERCRPGDSYQSDCVQLIPVDAALDALRPFLR